MNKKGQVQDTLKIVGVVLMALLFIAIISIVTFLVISNLTPSLESVASGRSGRLSGAVSVTPVDMITVNGTGYTFAECSAMPNSALTSITAVNGNGTYGTITAGNYTLSGCNVLGILNINKNAGWNVSAGTYNYVLTSQQARDMSGNLTIGIGGFFTQIPIIFTILGIVLLIGAIILIIYFVRRMSGGGGSVGL